MKVSSRACAAHALLVALTLAVSRASPGTLPIRDAAPDGGRARRREGRRPDEPEFDAAPDCRGRLPGAARRGADGDGGGARRPAAAVHVPRGAVRQRDARARGAARARHPHRPRPGDHDGEPPFDHYFAVAARGDGRRRARRGLVEPAPTAPQLPPATATALCIRDVNHGWTAPFRQWNGGRNDGFVTTNDPMGEARDGLPRRARHPPSTTASRGASRSATAIASVMGPTWPNRFYMLAATSFGITHNTPYAGDTAQTPAMHILRNLEQGGVEWRATTRADLRLTGIFPYFGIVRRQSFAGTAARAAHRRPAHGLAAALRLRRAALRGQRRHPPGRAPAGTPAGRRALRRGRGPRAPRVAAVAAHRALPHVRRARRLRRPRPAAGGVPARTRPGPSAGRYAASEQELLALRLPRPLRGRVALRAAGLRLARGVRPREHPALRRGALRPPR